MDTSQFYSVFSATCFGLVGLWWNVVQARKEWLQDPALKNLAGSIYLSFLLPGLMGLGAQIGGSSPLFWRIIFIIGSAFGLAQTYRLMRKTKNIPNPGPFRRHRWLVSLLYAFLLLGALGFDFIVTRVGLQPLQLEAFWLCLLILLAHGLAWEFLTEPKAE